MLFNHIIDLIFFLIPLVVPAYVTLRLYYSYKSQKKLIFEQFVGIFSYLSAISLVGGRYAAN